MILSTILLILKLIIVLLVIYFIYDYIQTPQYLRELTNDYNELVDQFHIAVQETAIAYIHIGSKQDGMPVTIQMRSITGSMVETKQSRISHPSLYVQGEIMPFIVFGYIQRDAVYVHSMKVRVSFDEETQIETGRLYIFDKNIVKDPDNPQVSHPATWVQADGLDENQFYQLVVNPAGLFTLVRIESFRNITGLPVHPPEHRNYKKALQGINRK
jgi:hypothetical protein